MRAKPEEIVSVLREEIQNYDTRVRRDETGTVLEVGDGIATVYGLDQAVYGELVELDTGVKGMVMNLARDSVGVVLLGSEAGVREGTVVRRTGRAADVPVGDGLIGRVVDGMNSRSARWYYLSSLANQGLGNSIDALQDARRAVQLDPNNTEYQMHLRRMQNPGQTYRTQTTYAQPGGLMRWCWSMILLNLLCNCCCGGGWGWRFRM